MSKREELKAEIEEMERIKELPGVKGWQSGWRNTHVNPQCEPDGTRRIEKKPTLDDYDS